MKNVKKLLKKAMVFTLAASMLVGTPLTASAAGIRGVYSISDGINENESGTGTVTNTDTGSGVLNANDAKIMGIVLDKETVNAVKGKKETLKATVIVDGEFKNAAEKEDVLNKLSKKIKWELSNADGSKDTNPAATVGISSSVADRTVVELNPKKGTPKDMAIRVTAKIDGSYYFVKDEAGNVVVKEYTNKVGTYTAYADVTVKEYTDELIKAPMDTAYVKHTLDMKEYITRKPATANDEITWSSTNTKVATVTADGVVTFKKVNTKENESGELELTKDADACQIIAVGERGGKATAKWDVMVVAGVQSSKIEIIDEITKSTFNGKKTSVDLRDDNDDWPKEVDVQMYKTMKVVVGADKKTAATDEADAIAGQKNGKYTVKNVAVANDATYYVVVKTEDGAEELEAHTLYITDTVTWTSNKPAIVSVKDNPGDNDTGAVLTAKSVGKAVITAKASSGKTDKLTVTVTATLDGLAIAVGVDDDEHIMSADMDSYTGKSYQLYARKDPAQSKDAVKWSIAKVVKLDENRNPVQKNGKDVMIANPNATINAKGVLTIKPTLDPKYADVTVQLQSAKKVKPSEDANGNPIKDYVYADDLIVKVEQSSIDGINVYEKQEDGTDSEIIASVGLDKSNKVKQNLLVLDKKSNTRTISVPKNKTYVARPVESKIDGYDTFDSADTLTWTTSNAKIASVEPAEDGTAKITANANGTATITVSGVRAVKDNKGNLKASAIKTTFKVSVKQPVKTVTLNKPSFVLNEKVNKKGEQQNQKVALKATLGPKGVDKKAAVHWSVKKNGEVLEPTAALGLKNKKDAEITAANISVNLPTPKVGDEFEITATTDSGASAKSTVKIVEKTNNVVIKNDDGVDFVEYDYKPDGTTVKKTYKNTKWLEAGDTTHMNVLVGVKTGNDVELKKAGTENREDVTYTVNKKGIVRVDDNGNVYALKAGKVTITAKTPLGKKATLTVVVK